MSSFFFSFSLHLTFFFLLLLEPLESKPWFNRDAFGNMKNRIMPQKKKMVNVDYPQNAAEPFTGAKAPINVQPTWYDTKKGRQAVQTPQCKAAGCEYGWTDNRGGLCQNCGEAINTCDAMHSAVVQQLHGTALLPLLTLEGNSDLRLDFSPTQRAPVHLNPSSIHVKDMRRCRKVETKEGAFIPIRMVAGTVLDVDRDKKPRFIELLAGVAFDRAGSGKTFDNSGMRRFGRAWNTTNKGRTWRHRRDRQLGFATEVYLRPWTHLKVADPSLQEKNAFVNDLPGVNQLLALLPTDNVKIENPKWPTFEEIKADRDVSILSHVLDISCQIGEDRAQRNLFQEASHEEATCRQQIHNGLCVRFYCEQSSLAKGDMMGAVMNYVHKFLNAHYRGAEAENKWNSVQKRILSRFLIRLEKLPAISQEKLRIQESTFVPVGFGKTCRDYLKKDAETRFKRISGVQPEQPYAAPEDVDEIQRLALEAVGGAGTTDQNLAAMERIYNGLPPQEDDEIYDELPADAMMG